jgi:hypothetical protein
MIQPEVMAPNDAEPVASDAIEEVGPDGHSPPELIPDMGLIPAMGPDNVAAPTDSSEGSIIPPSLIPQSPIESDDQKAPQDEPSSMTELPAGLRQFVPMLLQEGPAEETSLQTPTTINQIEIDAAAEEDSSTLGVDPPDPLNLKRDLGFKVALNSNGYPLPSLMLLMSEMTGVPIQLDWASFDLAGVDIAKPIKLDGKSKARSVRDWLDTIAEQVDGELRTLPFVIVMTISDAAFANAEAGLLDLSDFGDQSDSAAQVIAEFMADPVKELEPLPRDAELDAPDAGDVDADDGEGVDVESSEAGVDVMEAREKAQLKLLAAEMLRRMRSIEPRMPNHRASRWMQVSDRVFSDWQPISDLDPASIVAGPQTDTPMTTAAMLRRASSINDAVCMVNWHDANRRGMRPTRLIMPHADGATAAQMLASVLGPLSLEVRSVDAQHWWVGSGATYDRLPVLVQSKPLGDRRQVFENQLNTIMAADGSDVFRSAYDPVSDRMILLLPRYVARQLSKVAEGIAQR